MTSTLQSNTSAVMVTRHKITQKQKLQEQTVRTLRQLFKQRSMNVKTTQKKTDTIDKKCKTPPKCCNSELKSLDSNVTNFEPELRSLKVYSRNTNINQEKLSPGLACFDMKSKTKLTTESNEYYPNKLKRIMPVQRINLKPKYELKVVATTNKRKRTIPNRDVGSPIPKIPTPQDTDLNVEQLVRIMEGQRNLEDDDLLEILTCPSPVWWEDPPDGSYCEDAISIRLTEDPFKQDKPQNQTRTNEHINEINTNPYITSAIENIIDNTVYNLTVADHNIKKSIDYNEKRSKLESVLDNLKSKVLSNSDIPQNSNSLGKVRKNSVSDMSDGSINDEDLLRTLENLEIPIQDTNNLLDEMNNENYYNDDDLIANEETNEISKQISETSHKINELVNIESKVKYVKDINELNVHVKPVKPRFQSQENDVQKVLHKCKCNNNTNVFTKAADDFNTDKALNELDTAIPTVLPILTKNPYETLTTKSIGDSPRSIESLTSENTESSMEIDSISDSNIRFLDEYDDGKQAPNKIIKNIKSINGKNKKTATSSKNDLVTVYRIINVNNNNDGLDLDSQIDCNVIEKVNNLEVNEVNKVNEIEENCEVNKVNKRKENYEVNKTDNGKINDFYKKCKYTYKNKNKNHANSNCCTGNNSKSNKGDSVKLEKVESVKSEVQKSGQKFVEESDKNINLDDTYLVVPNTKVKYCHKCSTIFETETCQYCLKKSQINANFCQSIV